MDDTFLDNKILWVGPGMGDVMYYGPWPAAIATLAQFSEDPLKISHLKLLDIQGIPKMVFGDEYAGKLGIELQETAQGDFFQETDHWDIIILDRIEAWMLGKHYWPSLRETPYDLIAHEWEQKLLKLNPYQVWVRHDGAIKSTIIPNLYPDYELVVNIQTRMYGYKEVLGRDVSVAKNASYWSGEAIDTMRNKRLGFSTGDFEALHVWQLKQ